MRVLTNEYLKRDSDQKPQRSVQISERGGLDEARIKQSGLTDWISRILPQINLSSLLTGCRGRVPWLQIEPFYDPLGIHHATDQIDHCREWKREHCPETG